MRRGVGFIIAIFIAIPLFSKNQLSYIDATHMLLSDWIYNTSNKIDTFFSRNNEQISNENKSYLNLSFNSYLEEHESSMYRFNAKVNIMLPKTEKKLNLILEDFKNSISTDQQTSSNVVDTVQNNSYLLGVELDKIDTKFIKVNFGSGVHFSNISPDVYLSLYLAKIFYTSNKWEFEINNNGKYFLKQHLDNTANFIISRVINENYKFTFLNSYHYKQNANHLNEIINSLILDKYISPKKGISSSFSMYSSSDKTHSFKLYYYLAQISYKRFFYHNFAYYELTPGVIFRESDGFRPRARIVFRIGLYFSKFSLNGYKIY